MSGAVTLTLAEAEALATAALVASNTSPVNAASTARALVAAEADGQAGHGLSRVASYALHARVGKVDGHAVPTLTEAAAGAVRIDAARGFAYPAIDLAIADLLQRTPGTGIAAAVIRRSHHFGQAGAHTERLAERGLIALAFANTPKAMAFWGGRAPMLGTNPLAFAAPLGDGRAPLVIDMALSVAARGKIVAAQKAGKAIPADWAVDAEGQPTTDPTAALGGALSPIGGAKGAALALMVELLVAGLAGSAFGWEASSLFDDKGGPPDLGHVLIAIDPVRLSGDAFAARTRTLLAAMDAQPGPRLPGSRRLAARAVAKSEGLKLSAMLHHELTTLAAGAGNGT